MIKRRKIHWVRVQQGFTLIELMITLAVLAIILAIAIPSYSQYVERSNRTNAMEAMLSMAACQERTYTRTNAYDITTCGPPAGGNLGANYSLATTGGGQTFLITATPEGGQLGDNCGALTLNQTGAKTAVGDVDKCWGGRSG